jgi:argininosuccinate lyase
MLAVAAGAVRTTGFRDDQLRCKAENPALLATEAADYLVRKGLPFRQAHDVVGQVLKEAERRNVLWTRLPMEAVRRISPALDADIFSSLSVEATLSSKEVPGGTAPESVRSAIAELEKLLQSFNNETTSKAQAK